DDHSMTARNGRCASKNVRTASTSRQENVCKAGRRLLPPSTATTSTRLCRSIPMYLMAPPFRLASSGREQFGSTGLLSHQVTACDPHSQDVASPDTTALRDRRGLVDE